MKTEIHNAMKALLRNRDLVITPIL